ncbi:MAG: hypothetical protein QM692_01050 [Thermomicrobiales bacterium]
MSDTETTTTELRLPSGAPNLFVRVIWFIVVGWWLTGLLSAAAWALNATIIGLPLGLWIINRLPFAATLHPIERFYAVENGVVVTGARQRPFLIRALYFLLIGWWLSGLWMAIAYLALVTIIGIPLAFWMYNRVGAVTTLFRT